MYAIIKTGGKQYSVRPGQLLSIEKLKVEVGEQISFDEVLMVSTDEKNYIGTPTVVGSQVTAKVVEQGRHKKIHIIKFKRRKKYLKRQGHRQDFTKVEITDIKVA